MFFQVEDIETKVDQLMEMYMEDRHRMANLIATFTASPPPVPPSSPPSQQHQQAAAPPPKKSILVENKQFSEPTTPVAKSFEAKTIQRGNSDLSQRCCRKKRVTVRHSLEGGSPSLLAAPRIQIQPDRTLSGSDPASSESTLGTELDASEPDLRPDSEVTVVVNETCLRT